MVDLILYKILQIVYIAVMKCPINHFSACSLHYNI